MRGWEPRRMPAAGRPDVKRPQWKLHNIKKNFFKLKRKVKYVMLAGILQSDFESLIVK